MFYADQEIVWTYSSGLEKESGRFSQPGDFFTYIFFVGLVILVRKRKVLKRLSLHLLTMFVAFSVD